MLAGLSNSEVFILVSYQKKKKKIVLDTYQRGKLVNSRDLDIQDEAVFKELKEGGFTYIPTYNATSFEQAESQRKAYLHDNKVVLISDTWQQKDCIGLLIVEIDLLTGSVMHKSLPLLYRSKVDHNSFLWHNQLFVVRISPATLNLGIYSLSSLKKLKEYQYLQGETITLKESPLIRNRKNLDDEWAKGWRLSNIATFTLAQLNGGTPVISVSAAGEESFRLLSGNYTSPSGGGSMMPSGGEALVRLAAPFPHLLPPIGLAALVVQ